MERSVEEPGVTTACSAGKRRRCMKRGTKLRHSFSHYDLDIRPIVVRMDSRTGRVADTGAAVWHRLDDAPPGGLAAPVKILMDQLKKSEDVAQR